MQSYVLMLQADADDRYITESVIGEEGYDFSMKFIDHINELDAFIAREGLPVLILVSTSSVMQKGYNVVKYLKTHPQCGHIPVVALGEVSADDYIKEWYRAGANTFIVKPSTVAGTQKKIRTFFDYWFNVAALRQV